MFDITRNQYFLAGLVLLFLGIEFRTVESITLTPEFTQFLAERTGHPLASVNAGASTLTTTVEPTFKKTLHPPEWIGWSLISMGAVLILHSLAMKPPE